MTYRVHRFDIKRARDQSNLEQFLNGLDGEVVSMTPNVTTAFMWIPRVDFLLIVAGMSALTTLGLLGMGHRSSVGAECQLPDSCEVSLA